MTKEEMEALILSLETEKAEVDKVRDKEYAPNAWNLTRGESLIMDALIKMIKHEKEKP